MEPFDRFAELWSDYLEGELDERGMAELRALISNQPNSKAIAVDQYQLHRLLCLISSEDSEAFVDTTIQRLPANTDDFVASVVSRVTAQSQRLSIERGFPRKKNWIFAAAIVAASILILLLNNPFNSRTHKPIEQIDAPLALTDVKFTSTARTKFLGAFTPAIGSVAMNNHEYILTSGSVQMLFPNGAEVIVQGPAVFQVADENRLNVSVGRCSVHCPRGAEGFVVETPNTQVVDRGTRFFVNVVESSATEVHVVEGIAEVYRQSEREQSQQPRVKVNASSDMVRLKKHEARLFESDEDAVPQLTDFKSSLFQSQLPDRIIAYEATQEDGGAKNLESIDIQRGGKVTRYSAQQLIGAELTWFKIEDKIADMRHLAGGSLLPSDRRDLLLDLSLNTGAINPGGSVEPFHGDPVFPIAGADQQETTPGFAIEFVKPVINGPGPDLVFFELQSVTGAPDGDPFHVLPLKLGGNRKAITVKSYDLTLTSPESQRPANFYLHESERSVDSIDELLTGVCRVLPRPQGSAGYRVIAVTIDLSSMGFDAGEAVEGLFFQDVLDDQNHVDPVAIFGFPNL